MCLKLLAKLSDQMFGAAARVVQKHPVISGIFCTSSSYALISQVDDKCQNANGVMKLAMYTTFGCVCGGMWQYMVYNKL